MNTGTRPPNGPNGVVDFQLRSPRDGVVVDVRLREVGGRWVAVANRGGASQSGLGGTARDALRAALASLGPRASAALLADTELFAVSLSVV